ncbi:hypothetical protein ACHAQD_005310 [Fusarium lateritium]
MTLITFAFLSLLASAAARDIQAPKKNPVLGQPTSQGCFDSLPAERISEHSSLYNTVGTCSNYCKDKNMEVVLLQDAACFCSHTYPSKDSLVDDDQCDTPCPGYPNEACGGKDAFSVHNLGIVLVPGYDEGEDKGQTITTSTLSAPTKSAATTTAEASTSVSASTDSEKASATESEQGSASTAAIEEPSKAANSASDTPSPTASTVTNNGALRFSDPIGNLIRLMRQFWE